MNIICKMDGKPATLPCLTPSCPLYGDCVVAWEKEVQQPQSNGDWLRALDDEALAEALTDLLYRYGWVLGVDRQCCYNQQLDWLKQPHESEVDG